MTSKILLEVIGESDAVLDETKVDVDGVIVRVKAKALGVDIKVNVENGKKKIAESKDTKELLLEG